MIWNRLRSTPVLIGIGLSTASFILYLSTLAPTLTWGWNETGVDGGELLAAANTFGIPHPPGYPTYTLLLKTFATLVPIGDFAYRGNLLSAILASATVLMVYCATLRFCRSLNSRAPEKLVVTSAVLGSTVLASSPLFWSQAVMTEVYTLNALFAGTLLLIASLLVISSPSQQTPSNRRTVRMLALFGFLTGIGLGNHLTLLAVAIPLLYWLGSTLGWRRMAWPWIIGTFISGVAIYAYLPISASQNPPINWGNTDTIQGIAWMLSGRPYQQYVFGIDAVMLPGRLLSWAELVFAQFNPLGLYIGLMAIELLFAKARNFFIGAMVGIMTISIYTIGYHTIDFEVLMIPAFLLFSVWIGIGFFRITSILNIRNTNVDENSSVTHWWRKTSNHVIVLSILTFLLLPGISIVLNYDSQNLRGDHIASDYARSVLDTVPNDSVVLSHEEKNVFSLWYMRYVESPELDIDIIAVPLLQFDWYQRDIHNMSPKRIPLLEGTDVTKTIERIVEHNKTGGRVFFTFTSQSLRDSFDLEQIGIIYKATPKSNH